ncbi:protocadherin alpha-13 [Echinops telfairi]|uniref:Protocadherin alpha-13 n=1 Tax=Echinops telfairi TaxID=9371 RepID=A0ABM0ICQ2_ECHTE|nr:protocadherin alpha-13 [Echinops telfairi]
MVTSFRKGPGARRLLLSLLFATWEVGSGQLHYSVPEEAKHGTFVGRIAQDLGLELAELVPRLFRVASKGRGDLLEVNLQNGILFVNSRIDREELCGRSAACGIHLEVIVEQPLQVFHVEVEVKDINDHPPVFPWSQKTVSISESRLPDSRFPLEGATDSDIGANAVLTYRLTPSDYFSLNVISKSDQNKLIVLVLKKSLDREEIREHALLLTATDGGKPELTGSVKLLIKVLDVNDNAPEFQQLVYEVNLRENAINWTSVITLNASDVDEGPNQEITYHFSNDVSSRITEIFTIILNTGEIRLKGNLDYEEITSYEILVEAVDKGLPQMRGHCTVLVNILDMNDNAPDVSVTSLSLPIREDAPQGTVIALLNHGEPPLAATATVLVSLVENGQALKTSSRAAAAAAAGAAGGAAALVDVNVYLIIAICAVSSLLVLTLLLYTALRCSTPAAGGACGPGKPALVCSSGVGSWSSSQQRRPRVCSGEGPPKTDLMAFSPSLPPGGNVAERNEHTEGNSDLSGNVSLILAILYNLFKNMHIFK